jgi:hypothetical protein
MPNPSGSSCVGNKSSFQAHLALEKTPSFQAHLALEKTPSRRPQKTVLLCD